MINFNSEVCEMSLNQDGWPRRKKGKNSQFLAQTTLALTNRLSEKVYLEENGIKLVNTSFVEEIC